MPMHYFSEITKNKNRSPALFLQKNVFLGYTCAWVDSGNTPDYSNDMEVLKSFQHTHFLNLSPYIY